MAGIKQRQNCLTNVAATDVTWVNRMATSPSGDRKPGSGRPRPDSSPFPDFEAESVRRTKAKPQDESLIGSLIALVKYFFDVYFLQKDASSRWGMLTSLGVHIVVLLILWLVVLPGARKAGYVELQGWGSGAIGDGFDNKLPPGPGEGPAEVSAAPVTTVNVGSDTPAIGVAQTNEATSAPPESKTSTTPDETAPVSATGRLGNRSGTGRGGALDGTFNGRGGRGSGGGGGGGGGGKNDQADALRRCVDAGMAWIVRQQTKGGNWQLHTGYPDAGYSVARTDTGATALSLLALLGDGHTHTNGPHKEAVKKGLTWLKGIQKNDGDFHDHVELGRQTAFYAHAQATIAMCEAYALTKDESFKNSAQKGIEFLLNSQHPTNGGWRYQPQDGKSMGDLSVSGWCLMAMNTARIAEINVPPEPFGRVTVFLNTVESQNGGRYRYLPSDPAGKTSLAMTAEGLLCRQWLGWKKDNTALQDGVKYLLSSENLPVWAPGKRNVYEWYYMAQTLHNMGGDDWRGWFGQLQSEIVTHQEKAGGKPPNDTRGSWTPRFQSGKFGSNEEYSEKAGRLYLTAMCLLILETPYRHTPIYEDAPAK